LQILGLLYVTECKTSEKIIVDERNVEYFGKLSPRERLEYYLAASYLCSSKTADFHFYRYSGSFHIGQIRTIAAFIHQFLNFFESGYQYPRITLQRLAILLQCQGLGADQDKSVSLPNLERLLACLVDAGVIESDGSTFQLINSLKDFQHTEGEKNEEKRITLDTEFSFIMYPNINFSDALYLASFAEVRETGAAIRFEINRASAARGFDRGISADNLINALNRLSGNQTSPNLIYNLKDWESRYHSVSLHHGLVVCADEENRFLAQTEAFSRLIAKTLAPGVYLMNAVERGEVLKILFQSGIDMFAGNAPNGKTSCPIMFSALRANTAPSIPQEADAETASLAPDQAVFYKEYFCRILENSGIEKAKQNKLRDHIERRLILNETQLREECAGYEKWEAQSLDNAGKVIVIHNAIDAKIKVEVHWLFVEKENDQFGVIKRELYAVGTPKTLEKENNQQILRLETAENSVLKIPLRKISRIRGIKKSLFD
jgi:hypothetical protein